MSGTRAISTTSVRELSSSFTSCKARHRRKFTPFWQKLVLVGLRTYQHPCTELVQRFIFYVTFVTTWLVIGIQTTTCSYPYNQTSCHIQCVWLKWAEGVSLRVIAFLRKLRANLVPNLIKVFVLCSTQWANNYVTSPNTSTCTSPTAGKEIHHLTYNGSNFNNITASFQQQHRSSYSTSSEFLSESSPDDSLGDFEGTKFLTYMTGYCASPRHAVGRLQVHAKCAAETIPWE